MSELVLVPTPLADDLPLEVVALSRLTEDCLKENVNLLVEEHKAARQRWLKWGLPREAIERFQLFNEHTSGELAPQIIRDLQQGRRSYLLSDCGLPAFCDPGQNLVNLCHKKNIKVTSTPFPNSVALAIALSGFSHARFTFCGFVPVKEPQRQQWIKHELKRPETLVWMETPYRLKNLLDLLVESKTSREIFLALDLGSPQELLLRGTPLLVAKTLGVFEKREFVMVIGAL
jgi:16S rRNA (cytidine1402-2'-O)-methyltransferase